MTFNFSDLNGVLHHPMHVSWTSPPRRLTPASLRIVGVCRAKPTQTCEKGLLWAKCGLSSGVCVLGVVLDTGFPPDFPA